MPGGSRRADELNRAHLADEGREESTSGERAPEKRSQAGGHRARGDSAADVETSRHGRAHANARTGRDGSPSTGGGVFLTRRRRLPPAVLRYRTSPDVIEQIVTLQQRSPGVGSASSRALP